MKRTLFTMLLIAGLALVAVGCAGQPPAETPTDQPATPDPDQPVSSDDPTPTPDRPAPGQDLITGEIAPDSIDILFLESFPLQVNVIARGNLPDGCTEIDGASQVLDGSTFWVTLTTRRPADEMCTQALVPFEYAIPLDVYGLPAGTYTVDVGGVTDSFTFETDNTLPDDPASGGEIEYGLAPITSVSVITQGTPSGKPEAVIQGYLPDGCTELHSISDRLEGSIVRVTVETRRPVDAMCTMAIEEFETRHTLMSVPGRGTYTLDVNGTAIQFTVP